MISTQLFCQFSFFVLEVDVLWWKNIQNLAIKKAFWNFSHNLYTQTSFQRRQIIVGEKKTRKTYKKCRPPENGGAREFRKIQRKWVEAENMGGVSELLMSWMEEPKLYLVNFSYDSP